MPDPQKRPLGAANMTASELLAAQDPEQFDGKIAEFVATRESAHDRERRAVAAEAKLEERETALRVATEAFDRDAAKVRKQFDEREAAVAAKEAELEPKVIMVEEFKKWQARVSAERKAEDAKWKAEDAKWKAEREAWDVQCAAWAANS